MSDRDALNPGRVFILPDELQLAITGAVRKAEPACQSFVGVLVERPDGSAAEANWAVKGIKFEKADRTKASSALGTIVERMQQEFNLAVEDKRPRSRSRR